MAIRMHMETVQRILPGMQLFYQNTCGYTYQHAQKQIEGRKHDTLYCTTFFNLENTLQGYYRHSLFRKYFGYFARPRVSQFHEMLQRTAFSTEIKTRE